MRKVFFLLLTCFYSLVIKAQSNASYWNLTGNGSTSPGTNFIGTTDAQRLVLKTNNVEQATILTNGDVGIGTAAPDQRLDINGTGQLRRIADANSLAPLKNSNALQLQSAYWNGSSSVNSNWKLTSIQTSTTDIGSELLISQHDGLTRFMMGYSGFNFYDRNSGFIMGYDIGTDRLHISKSLWTNSVNNYGQVNTTSVGGLNWSGSKIIFDNPWCVSYYATGDGGTDYTAHRFTVAYAMTGTNSLLASWDNGGASLVAITKEGKLGVGSTSPTEKLHVNGNIYTNGKILINQANTAAVAPYALAVNGTAIFTKAMVKLNSNWPDYVFEPCYKLLPLPELETYLLKNKHLPDMPSAVEVGKNGIDLGNNQSILLKKVEELTLYMIELNKKVDTLDRENQELRKRIDAGNR